VVGILFERTRKSIVPRLVGPPNVKRQNVKPDQGSGGPAHSLISAQEMPLPEKPVLHAHVKAPSVSVHAALMSQLWVPSAIEGRGPSPLLSRPSVSAPLSIRAR